MIAPHAHTPCDTFMWSVGGREVFSYETEIGERWRGTIGAYLTRPWCGRGMSRIANVYPSQLVEVPFESAPVEFARDPAWQVRGRNELEVRLARPGAGLVLQDVRVCVRYQG